MEDKDELDKWYVEVSINQIKLTYEVESVWCTKDYPTKRPRRPYMLVAGVDEIAAYNEMRVRMADLNLSLASD